MTEHEDLTGDLEAGYRALRDGGAVVDVERDRVTITGPQAEEFLQGQLSQDVSVIERGTSRCSFLLQPTGKVDAWFRIGPIDDGFAIDVAGGFGEPVQQRLARFKLRTKVEITNEPGAASRPRVRAERLTTPAVDILTPAVECMAVPDASDLPLVGVEAFECARIQCGVPRLGAELTDQTIPAEAGQWIIDQSVSFTKGCYTGQELVARIDSRGGNVPRHLRGVVVDGEPPVGAAVVVDGTDVGSLTSVAPSVRHDGFVALAYIARKVEPPVEGVVRWAGAEAPARIESLPLV